MKDRAGCAIAICVAFATVATTCSRATQTAPSPIASIESVAARTFLSFASKPGDPIGGGQTREFTPSNASFAVTGDNDLIRVRIREASGVHWALELGALPGTRLAAGSYAVNEPVSSDVRSAPYIAFRGNGIGCIPVGRFTVHDVVYGPDFGVSRLRATFEQRCPQSPQGLTGEVQIAEGAGAGATVANVAGSWSGRLEGDAGVYPTQVLLTQSGSSVSGTWTSGDAWSGLIQGNVALGGFSGTITLAGRVPRGTGPVCEGRAPFSAFVSDGMPELALQSVQFEGSCPFMPFGLRWILQSRR